MEPRMIREESDELLADHAGRAENPNRNRRHQCESKKKADAENRVGRVERSNVLS